MRSCAKAAQEYERRGYAVIQSGEFDDGRHYRDTEWDFGYGIELGKVGKIRLAERRYPN